MTRRLLIRFGHVLSRRFLLEWLVIGCIGIGVSHLLCAWAYHAQWRGTAVLVLTLSAIACYALTLAPVTWVLIAEILHLGDMQH